MVEVISLLSSPLKTPGLPLRKSPRQSHARPDKAFDLYFDNSDSTGDLSPIVLSASKKRKLNDVSTKQASATRLGKRAAAMFDYDLPDTTSTNTKQFKATKTSDLEFSDPIVYSSSAPQPKTTQKASKVDFHGLSDDFDLPEDIFSRLPPILSLQGATTIPKDALRQRTSNLLAGLTGTSTGEIPSRAKASKASVRKPGKFRMIGASTAGAAVVDDIFSSSPPAARPKAAAKSKPSATAKAAEAVERAQVRAALKASKDADKEAEKERQRLEKEGKAREKQKADDLAEVNRRKTDKKVSAKEMILDLPREIQGTSTGNQIEAYMEELEVELKYVDEEIDLSLNDEAAVTYPGNLVKWHRKVEAEYNEDADHWERLAKPKIEQVNHLLIYLTAMEFATIAAQPPTPNTPSPIDEAEMKINLNKHLTYLHSRAKDTKPIYLIEGLDTWLRKNAAAKNRAYTAAVRAQADDFTSTAATAPPPSSQAPKKRKKNPSATSSSLDLSHFTPDLCERLQLHLQLHPLRPLIHLTSHPTNTATWLKSFTEHLSTVPYRRAELKSNLATASFCMASGQVRSGDSVPDTYLRMLQEVQRVTPSMAHGIAGEYPDVRSLVCGFKKHGEFMLQDVRKSANKDGAVSERRLGAMVSRRLCRVFTGVDPNCGEGVA